MRLLLLLPAARADLRNIRRFGRRTWGAAQASTYAADLQKRLEALVRGELSEVAADELGPNLRRLVAGSHVIWFRVERDRLRVLRVLSQKQDPSRHLR